MHSPRIPLCGSVSIQGKRNVEDFCPSGCLKWSYATSIQPLDVSCFLDYSLGGVTCEDILAQNVGSSSIRWANRLHCKWIVKIRMILWSIFNVHLFMHGSYEWTSLMLCQVMF